MNSNIISFMVYSEANSISDGNGLGQSAGET